MKNKFIKYLTFILIILFSIFAGYENPKLVEVPKKYYYFFLKKIGLSDRFVNIDKKEDNIQSKKKSEEYFANSFSLNLEKVKSYEGKTASIFLKKQNKEVKYEIFTRKGLRLTNDSTSEINLPLNFYLEQDGGVKSVFQIKGQKFALISQKQLSCIYASIFNISYSKEIIKSKCIPDKKLINFGGLGGAYVFDNDSLILSIGVPTHLSEEIDNLSQDNDSIFGKLIKIKKNDILEENVKYSFFSTGHRNPQGLVKFEDTIFSLEHGPQGGDELNEIKAGNNYGWPIASLGTRYNNGRSFSRSHKKLNFIEPIYSFLPAVAPSSLNKCPKNLSLHYENFTCLMGLSLKEMSLIIFLLKKDPYRIFSIEKIRLDKRLRHFGLNYAGKIFNDDDGYFYFSSDTDGLYKAKFSKFRK